MFNAIPNVIFGSDKKFTHKEATVGLELATLSKKFVMNYIVVLSNLGSLGFNKSSLNCCTHSLSGIYVFVYYVIDQGGLFPHLSYNLT